MPWVLAFGGLVAGIVVNLLADSLPAARRVDPPSCPACHSRRPLLAWSATAAFVAGRRRCAVVCTPPRYSSADTSSLAAR